MIAIKMSRRDYTIMANTYTQIHIHFVFAVKYRKGIIHTEWKDDLYKYITGIVQNNGHKMLAINGVEDHIHIFIGMRPTQSISSLLQDIKANSSKWINEHAYTEQKFEWQAGYGAFSYSMRDLPTVAKYIERQEEHHRKKTFRQEFIQYLKEFEIDYKEQNIFTEPK